MAWPTRKKIIEWDIFFRDLCEHIHNRRRVHINKTVINWATRIPTLIAEFSAAK
jgi:hypothetical protein